MAGDVARTTPTALPSVTARALGFVAIVASGAIGAFISWGFTDLQCQGDCTTPMRSERSWAR